MNYGSVLIIIKSQFDESRNALTYFIMWIRPAQRYHNEKKHAMSIPYSWKYYNIVYDVKIMMVKS
jgi:hypothetical protein